MHKKAENVTFEEYGTILCKFHLYCKSCIFHKQFEFISNLKIHLNIIDSKIFIIHSK